MRRLALALVLLPLLPAVHAHAQEESSVRITLVNQTPFAARGRPARISVEATNTGVRPIRNLNLSLSVYHPARSRSEYRQGLDVDPPVALLLVSPLPVRGALEPGETRTITIDRSLPELRDRGESALHPIKIQLESDGVPIASLRSVLVYVAERQLVPLNVSLTFVLDEPIALRPGGAFSDDGLMRSIEPGGQADSVVSALEQAPMESTLVISPLLLMQLDRMSNGFRVVGDDGTREVAADDPEAQSADSMLDRIRRLARNPSVEVVPLPLASPSVPALVEARLGQDLAAQMARGQEEVSRLLRTPVETDLFRPPGPLLSPRSVRLLANLEVESLILDPDTLQPPTGLTLSPPATAAIGAGQGRIVTAITPDPGLQQLLAGGTNDPRLQAQLAIGELSAIYFEQPGVDRGVSLVFGENNRPDGELLRRFLVQLRQTSPQVSSRTGWLRPVKASRLVRGLGDDLPRRALRRAHVDQLSAGFLVELRQARTHIEQLESVGGDGMTGLIARLQTLMLISQSRQFLQRELDGIAFLRAIRERVDEEFAKIEPPSSTAITLTSTRGVIPVTVGSSADYPMRVRVRLLSPRLDFVEGSSQDVVLDRPRKALTFPVLAQTTGRFPVRILIETPQGARISESNIVVRSTAYNANALVVTIAAALFLLFLWGRRTLSRAKR